MGQRVQGAVEPEYGVRAALYREHALVVTMEPALTPLPPPCSSPSGRLDEAPNLRLFGHDGEIVGDILRRRVRHLGAGGDGTAPFTGINRVRWQPQRQVSTMGGRRLITESCEKWRLFVTRGATLYRHGQTALHRPREPLIVHPFLGTSPSPHHIVPPDDLSDRISQLCPCEILPEATSRPGVKNRPFECRPFSLVGREPPVGSKRFRVGTPYPLRPCHRPR